MNVQISTSLAFIAGLASFLSPCVLPLVPIYLAQLVGPSIHQATDNITTLSQRLTTLLHAFIFVSGFTLSFVALGATASTLGYFLRAHLIWLQHIGGIILIIMGLHVIGLLRIPLLYRQKRFFFRATRPSYASSLLCGIIFALAWTPCIGPILSSILILASSTTTLQQGVGLLLAYSLGLGVPFLLLGFGLNEMSHMLKRFKPHMRKVEIGSGIFLVVIGIAVYFNLFLYLSNFLGRGIG